MNIKEIIIPIEGNNAPIGTPNIQSEFFNDVEREIMKIGSLQHGDVAWDVIYNQSINYLKKECKDYKVIGFLMRYMLQTKDLVKITQFLKVLAEFNKQYLFGAYPAPNAKKEIKGAKQRILKLIFSYLETFIRSEIKNIQDADDTKELLISIVSLEKQLSGSKILSEYLQTIAELVDSALQTLILKNDAKQVKQKGNVVAKTDNITDKDNNNVQENTTDVSILPPHTLSLDSIRDVKLSYLKLAEHSNATIPSDILGYSLRRFAMWNSITTVPLINGTGHTEMTAVSVDRVADYKQELASSPSITLLRKIEKTLETSPFWFEGNYLSFQCAELIGYKDVSKEIRRQTQKILNRFPSFYEMKFRCGTDFVSHEVKSWLQQADKPECSQIVEIKISEFSDLYNECGILDVLKQIDKQYELSVDIRDKFNLRLEKINYLHQEGMNSMLIAELKELARLSRDYTVFEWEQSFFNKINEILSDLENENE